MSHYNLVQKLTAEVANREAARLELAILSGCDGCGARVIYIPVNGEPGKPRPIAGAQIVSFGWTGQRFILCADCIQLLSSGRNSGSGLYFDEET